MLTFIKLGGSLITDKRVESSFHPEILSNLAAEIHDALRDDDQLQILVAHGSGSFGHFAASRYGTMQGVKTPDQWRGFAEVATVAAKLNYLVANSLSEAGVPVWRLQPSASAHCADGVIIDLALQPIRTALDNQIVPLLYGDVALDTVRGGTIISTEAIFYYLAQHLPVRSILLLGEVDGVYDASGAVIPIIKPSTFAAIQPSLGGSAGVDVTGGMAAKVREMLSLVELSSNLSVRVMNGTENGLLYRTLLNQSNSGTLISSDI